MTLTIEFSDDQASALSALAAAQGLSLEAWLKKLAYDNMGERYGFSKRPSLQCAAELILEGMRNIPQEIMASMPEDGASQHDHYIYGWPKRDV